MEKLLKEYQGWLTDNKNFYEHLKSHESALFVRFQPVYDVLFVLFQEYKDHPDQGNEDIEKIFQVGLEYLNMQFFTCKMYLKKTFNNNFHHFLEYDQVINYSLFLEDLKYELVEKSISYDEKAMESIADFLDDIIENKKEIPDNLGLYVDGKIHQMIDVDDYHFTGIIDIFVEIADALGISFDDEQDITIERGTIK
ncbi:MAG: hypothetical protein RBR96_00530 [Candidatus Izemoplasmatales bacterium]|jgi:hypothetical protein|nr:hypothetical protein [Candidatus Izemoplasmatales bacterium]